MYAQRLLLDSLIRTSSGPQDILSAYGGTDYSTFLLEDLKIFKEAVSMAWRQMDYYNFHLPPFVFHLHKL